MDQTKKKGQSPKLQPIWKGPLLVTQVLCPILFKVAYSKKMRVLHHDRLKPCGDRDVPLWLRRKRHVLLQTQVDNASNVDNQIPQDESLDLHDLFAEQDTDLEDKSLNLHDTKVNLHISPVDKQNDLLDKPKDSAFVSKNLLNGTPEEETQTSCRLLYLVKNFA